MREIKLNFFFYRVRVVALALLLLLGLSGCGSSPSGGVKASESTKAPPASITVPTRPPVALDPPRQEVLLSFWNGMPIMDDALSPHREGNNYVYLVFQPINAVEAYYRDVLARYGWQQLDRQYISLGMYGGPGVTLKYRRQATLASVLLAYSPNKGYTQVTLVLVSN